MNATVARSPQSSAFPASDLTLARARRQQAELENWLFSREVMSMTLDEVQVEQERRTREISRQLLQAHIQARGKGDVGPALEVAFEGGLPTKTFSHRRARSREAVTVFGMVDVTRQGYGSRGAESIHPLDAELSLPARSFTYEVQRRAVTAAVQGPFEEAVERIQEATGVVMPKRSAEGIVRDAAAEVDAFYATRIPPATEGTGPIVVGAVDGKGIPMRRPEPASKAPRRAKGKKANKKRMATVATVFTQQRRIRTPEEVVESLFRVGPRPVDKTKERFPGPEHKRVWASLVAGKDAVITEVGAEMKRRDPDETKTHAVVTDGERALQRRVMKLLPGAILILDLLHVLEKLWRAAYCFHEEGSQEAEDWVKERALRILRGDVSQVVKGLRQMVTKRRMRGTKAKTVLEVAAYFYNNRRRMKYDEYLKAGLPIASGAVEGACKNIIKDRMERSGMRWTEEMAEAMVKLRATYLSGDLEEYWKFHVKEDQKWLRPNAWCPVVEK